MIKRRDSSRYVGAIKIFIEAPAEELSDLTEVIGHALVQWERQNERPLNWTSITISLRGREAKTALELIDA